MALLRAMLWVSPPPDSLWKHPADSGLWSRVVSPSQRTVQILRLQNLYSIGQLADAAVSGMLHAYPDWFRTDVEMLLRRLSPVMQAVIEAERLRRARIARVDWAPTVIGRPLTADEVARLWEMDIRQLRCHWAVRHIAWYLGATDALDAAALDRDRVIGVKTSGPRRFDMLRTAIAGALRGDVEPDDAGAVPRSLSAANSVAGRSLSLDEVGRLAQQSIAELQLPPRAACLVAELQLETALDLAAVLDRTVTFRPGFGRGTLATLRRSIAARLDPLTKPAHARV
jgi:hypothetical protein